LLVKRCPFQTIVFSRHQSSAIGSPERGRSSISHKHPRTATLADGCLKNLILDVPSPSLAACVKGAVFSRPIRSKQNRARRPRSLAMDELEQIGIVLDDGFADIDLPLAAFNSDEVGSQEVVARGLHQGRRIGFQAQRARMRDHVTRNTALPFRWPLDTAPVLRVLLSSSVGANLGTPRAQRWSD